MMNTDEIGGGAAGCKAAFGFPSFGKWAAPSPIQGLHFQQAFDFFHFGLGFGEEAGKVVRSESEGIQGGG